VKNSSKSLNKMDISELKNTDSMTKSVLTISGANISILEENEDIASTKDSEANSLYSLNDQLFNRLFTSNERKMSVVSLISCKELEKESNSNHDSDKKDNPSSLYYKVLIQGLDSNDYSKVKKWLTNIESDADGSDQNSRLNELRKLSREYLQKFLIVLLRIMSEGGCMYRIDLVLMHILKLFPREIKDMKQLIMDLKSITRRKIME